MVEHAASIITIMLEPSKRQRRHSTSSIDDRRWSPISWSVVNRTRSRWPPQFTSVTASPTTTPFINIIIIIIYVVSISSRRMRRKRVTLPWATVMLWRRSPNCNLLRCRDGQLLPPFSRQLQTLTGRPHLHLLRTNSLVSNYSSVLFRLFLYLLEFTGAPSYLLTVVTVIIIVVSDTGNYLPVPQGWGVHP